MSVVCRSAAFAAALAAMLAFGANAHAQSKCNAGKAKLAGKLAYPAQASNPTMMTVSVPVG